MKRYILAIESMINDFSFADAFATIRFSYKSNSNPAICGLLEIDDTVLLYRKNDINLIYAEMVVVEKNGDAVSLCKNFEFSTGIKIEDEIMKEKVVTDTLVEINDFLYQDIKHRLIEANCDDSKNKEKKFPERLSRSHVTHELNTILYGAPGTGKTYSTAEYALAILENRPVDKSDKTIEQRAETMKGYKKMVDAGRIVFTTFHQSYGYEDFIQGLRPVANSSNMTFKPVDGVFKEIADRAMGDTTNDYVIIIDEINRANISKVFGELITLIEDDKRWGEVNALSVTLPSREAFAVPNNLYIVGTMNSADKSISLIDTALRRRFEFVEVTPNVSLVDDDVLKEVLKRINDELLSQLESTDLLIGHAYFIGKEASDLCTIMNRSIIPLLYEYFYDNSKKVKALLEKAINGFDFSVVGGDSGRLKIIVKA